MVIEVKYPDGGNLEAGCREALAQIERMDYGEKLRRNGMETILKYGVACDRKRCRIELARTDLALQQWQALQKGCCHSHTQRNI
mgnify:CR=1 FL=1